MARCGFRLECSRLASATALAQYVSGPTQSVIRAVGKGFPIDKIKRHRHFGLRKVPITHGRSIHAVALCGKWCVV